MIEQQVVELPREGAGEKLSGFRLRRLELFNWGTFDKRVWTFYLHGKNALLTGDIGSGKSTLVDAVTTLLVPAQRIAYNKAAGADAKERTLRSYVAGYYKSERHELNGSAKPVPLRGQNSFSVILGVFHNEGYDQTVTLAQVFWTKESQGQPARFFVGAEKDLSITENFANFGTDMTRLRKKLRHADAEVFDTFPPYGAYFRRRFGIEHEQALELFHQTVSMKSVGNLTEFVRHHMLEAFEVQPRIEALISHFDDLNRAHEAVLKAKKQVEKLTPLVENCDQHHFLMVELKRLCGCREALKPYFAGMKLDLLNTRRADLVQELILRNEQLARLKEKKDVQQTQERELRQAIAENGGDRLERIQAEIHQKEEEKVRKIKKADRYAEHIHKLGLIPAQEPEAFLSQRQVCAVLQEQALEREAEIQNHLNEVGVVFAKGMQEQKELAAEISSLKARRSNIDEQQIAMRKMLCDALKLKETEMPFAGELIQVREEERDWQGAIERYLRSFGLSLLVPDRHYASVADWVDHTSLKGRLVYFRVRAKGRAELSDVHPDSLVKKISIKPESVFYDWLEKEVAHRFDVACCTTQEHFRRETKAMTRAGQIKSPGERHEKDDRFNIKDQSRYVLGWSNEAKIEALESKKSVLEKNLAEIGTRIAVLRKEQEQLKDRMGIFFKLEEYHDFNELDWRPVAEELVALQEEKRQLEATSDILKTLTEQLNKIQEAVAETERLIGEKGKQVGATEQRKDHTESLYQQTQVLLEETSDHSPYFEALQTVCSQALGDVSLTVESCDSKEREMNGWLQKRIDSEDAKIKRLSETIVKAMSAFNLDYPLETQEMDASVGAADEYRKMLEKLNADALPRFEARFKELLNENTIREIANFQSQLERERATIKERIGRINDSLIQINYNEGRYIVLEAQSSMDADIRDFQSDLRACTEGALTGSQERQYSEAKFLQVKHIIERFRGREGQSDQDRRWAIKVTDVRNWFVFGASERWREDHSEHEHYSDSGGKSGGQKEKLAYTILAASLAYQFGLEWGVVRSRSFRFVVIDEAFGRGSDESARYGLSLFKNLNLQLMIVTPLQKIHIIEPYVSNVGFVYNEGGRDSRIHNLTIEEFQAEKEKVAV